MIAVGLSVHMDANSTSILCDGCGLPASPEHIAARMERLELVTRFRPIHIQVLFVALDPPPRPEDEFYRPPEARRFFDSLLSALDISTDAESNPGEAAANLLEFQRRGYYLTYLSECPLPVRNSTSENADGSAASESISRLAPTLVKRIRFNYKPKHVALLGANLSPLIEIFGQAGVTPLLLLDQGRPLTVPSAGDAPSLFLFQRTVNIDTSRAPYLSGV
jgi:hypothetical protein